MHDAAAAAIPKRRVTFKSDKKIWVTAELRRNIRKHDRLFRLAKQSPTDSNWSRWRYQRNLVTSMNIRLKNAHIHSQVQKLLSHKRDPYKYHQTLRIMTGRCRDDAIPPLQDTDGHTTTDDFEKATLLNDHFAAQSTLHIPAHHKPPPSSPDRQPVPTLENITTDELEVLSILNSLDQNKSTGPDNLPIKLLKLTALLIAKPLSQLFNKSLAVGAYPKKFKEANVKPIFKNKGSPSDPSCYRPISVLSALSKVFEK